MSLPLALDLAGRLVVAVGGGPVSARRVRALVEEGAVVRVVAPWLCEDLVDLLDAGRLVWVDRDYAGPADLVGAWLVHTAVGEPAVDTAVARDAAGVEEDLFRTTSVPEALDAAALLRPPLEPLNPH